MTSIILNVGADDERRQRITRVVRQLGCRVIEARSDSEALTQLAAAPQLVIVDLQPPGAVSDSLAAQIRRRHAERWIPILELRPRAAGSSGEPRVSTADAIIHSQFDDFSLISIAKGYLQAVSECSTRSAVEEQLRGIRHESKSLELTNERIISLLESITDGFYSLDREWRFIYMNRAAERISQRSREELLGKSIWDAFPESINTPAYDYYHRAVRENVSITFELFYAPLGVWLEINAYPTPDGLLALYREISDRKRAEASLSQFASLQATIASIGKKVLAGVNPQELLSDAAIEVARTLEVEYASIFELQPFTGSLLLRAGVGWPEERYGATWVDANPGTLAGAVLLAAGPVAVPSLPDEDRFSVDPLLQEHGIVSDLSVVIHGPDQPYGLLGVHTRSRREFTAQELTFVHSVANTLSAALRQHALEEDLRQSQSMLARAQRIGRVGSWAIEAGAETVFWSDGVYRIFGLQRGEFTPRLEAIQARIHPEDREAAAEHARMALECGGGYQLDHRILLADGEVRWVQVRAERETEPDGRSRLVGTVLDITEQKRADEELRESEQRYRVLFDRSPFPKMLYDEQSLRFLAVNDTAAEHYGFSREELQACTLEDIWVLDSDADSEAIRNLPVREAIRATHRRRDGTHLQVEVQVQKAFLRGQPVRIAVVQDLSERARLEGQLRQAQKMEAVGRLAGGVAHDFNNMLAVIGGYSEMLLHLTESEGRADLRRPLQEIQKAVERAARLTRQLLAFSRKQVLSPKVLDLGSLVRDLERMLSRLIGEDIDVHVSVAPDLRPVQADPGQLEQVLLNLVVNSRDAMPTGGKITIEVQNAELDEEYARRHQGVEPGEYVLLAVTDSGCGMNAETLEHAFEPFFTTKGPEQGTGLGLATVFGIVQQSGGHLQAYSEVGIGTTIKVYLPCAQQEAPPAPAPAAMPSAGKGTVLLVEDEVLVRALVNDVLTMFGYTVLAASNGMEALEIVDRLAPDVDLLLTDVVMPGGIGGRQLAEQLRAQRPSLKVLYMSGYTDDAVVRHGIVEADTAFIQKPFTAVALARKVKEVLG